MIASVQISAEVHLTFEYPSEAAALLKELTTWDTHWSENAHRLFEMLADAGGVKDRDWRK